MTLCHSGVLPPNDGVLRHEPTRAPLQPRLQGIWRQSAQLAQRAAALYVTTLRRPQPPKQKRSAAKSRVSWLRTAPRIRKRHCWGFGIVFRRKLLHLLKRDTTETLASTRVGPTEEKRQVIHISDRHVHEVPRGKNSAVQWECRDPLGREKELSMSKCDSWPTRTSTTSEDVSGSLRLMSNATVTHERALRCGMSRKRKKLPELVAMRRIPQTADRRRLREKRSWNDVSAPQTLAQEPRQLARISASCSRPTHQEWAQTTPRECRTQCLPDDTKTSLVSTPPTLAENYFPY